MAKRRHAVLGCGLVMVLVGCETHSRQRNRDAVDLASVASGDPDLAGAPSGAKDLAGAAVAPPEGPGDRDVSVVTATIANAAVVASVPALPSGARAPLILLKHGYQLATSNYADLAARLASHGFFVVGVDTEASFVGGPTNADERDATIAALDWALGDAPFADAVDAAHVAVVGHSRGGKVAVMVAAADPRITAALLLDPVNGCGPGSSFSTTCPDVTSAGYAPALTIPVGVMGETWSGDGSAMPCAPLDQNYATIFTTLTSSSWAVQWTFDGADHMDFTDDGGGIFGSFCADGPGDDAAIRAAVHTVAVAFARLHLRQEAAMTAWLTGASLPAGIAAVGP